MKILPRNWSRRLSLCGVFLVLCAVALILVVQSAWFARKVRDRIIDEVEHASGGRTEIDVFQFDWRTFTARVDGFTLHGTEGPSEAPLLRVSSFKAGLGVTSFLSLSGIHVRSIAVDHPAIHIIGNADGTTNLPEPKVKASDTDFIDTLLDLGAGTLTVTNGMLDLNERRVPLDLRVEDLDLHLAYNRNRQNRYYLGGLKSGKLELLGLPVRILPLKLEAQVRLEHGSILVNKARFTTRESRIEVSGFAYHLLNPASDFGVNAVISIPEWRDALHLPLAPHGGVVFAGKVSLSLKEQFRYTVEGKAKANALAFERDGFRIDQARAEALIHVDNDGFSARRLHVATAAGGGSFDGALKLRAFRDMTLDGDFHDFESEQLAVRLNRKLPFSATIDGQVHYEAKLGANLENGQLRADLLLTAAAPQVAGNIPLAGAVHMGWKQSTNELELAPSHLETSATSVDVDGTLGRSLHVKASTTRLADIQPLLTEPLPVELINGSIDYEGSITGPLADPKIDGKLQVTNVAYQKQHIDQATADFTLTRQSLQARSFTVAQGPLRLAGGGSLTLNDWKAAETSPFDVRVTVRGARIEKLLAEFGEGDLPAGGALAGTVHLRGTAKSLSGELDVTAEAVTAWDEPFDRIHAAIIVRPALLELTDATILFQKTTAKLSGSFAHPEADWKSGTLHWKALVPQIDVTKIHNVQSRLSDWKALLVANVSGAAELRNSDLVLKSVEGNATASNIAFQGRPLGTIEAQATMPGASTLHLTATAKAREGTAKLEGEWRLNEAGYPGGGTVSVNELSIQTLRDLALGGDRAPLPFESGVIAGATFRAPLAKWSDFTADVHLRSVYLSPNQNQKLGAGAKKQDLILRNVHEVIFRLTPAQVVLEPAQFRSTNSDITIGGKYGFDAKQGLDATVKGGLDLAQLQVFKQDLLASGSATIDAVVRGSVSDPQVNGTLALKNASLYFSDLPTGLDAVNGAVTFDRNRATIQKLDAQSGGGTMSLTGFVGFGGPALVYRLQGEAKGVRIRYPEGASTTANASLSLTGTSQESLLAGTVTVVRAAFTPRSDLGALMTELMKPGAPSPPPNSEYIRGMQLDVRIESVPGLEFQTALSKGLQAEVDLRLRGSAARPTLLGNVGFSEGEISLFGNKYTLNRGDIRFFNPTRIEPVLDLEAETRARGIDVNITFSGTPSKLNVAYRSDPPLQPSEIIALLAIGRDPNVSAGIASSQITQQSAAAGLGSVVGEAVASSVTNRLQRFFGVTRIKIDPQLTGLDNIPQARLTLEQQVSKDITLTYITNLARTQEQIVRIEWSFSREWSALAVREENGLFGIDFQYKKRFK